MVRRALSGLLTSLLVASQVPAVTRVFDVQWCLDHSTQVCINTDDQTVSSRPPVPEKYQEVVIRDAVTYNRLLDLEAACNQWKEISDQWSFRTVINSSIISWDDLNGFLSDFDVLKLLNFVANTADLEKVLLSVVTDPVNYGIRVGNDFYLAAQEILAQERATRCDGLPTTCGLSSVGEIKTPMYLGSENPVELDPGQLAYFLGGYSMVFGDLRKEMDPEDIERARQIISGDLVATPEQVEAITAFGREMTRKYVLADQNIEHLVLEALTSPNGDFEYE